MGRWGAENTGDKTGFDKRRQKKGRYLHSEEGDTGEEVHCGLEVLQPLGTAGGEVVLQSDEEKTKYSEAQHMTSYPSLSPVCLCDPAKETLVTVCAVFPECACACFRGAVSLINTSACFASLLLSKRKGEVQ